MALPPPVIAAIAVGATVLTTAIIGAGAAIGKKAREKKKRRNALLARLASAHPVEGPVTVSTFRHGSSTQQCNWLRPILPVPTKATRRERNRAILSNSYTKSDGTIGNECSICLMDEATIIYLPCNHAVACCDCDIQVYASRLSNLLSMYYEDDQIVDRSFIETLMKQTNPSRRLQIRCGICRTPVEQRLSSE